ncbi:MAG TPA: inorganic diphosphatase [Vicinamibacterales bacterium]|nr:inorganic diphosphatase [Vicinamibacterales bacterium]
MACGRFRFALVGWALTLAFVDSAALRAQLASKELPAMATRQDEFDMGANARAVDRVMSEALGGYPVNYGFVPQTVSYDGDPFDVLILGPALAGGTIVRGVIVGLFVMEDEKGPDAKVVVSPMDENGHSRDELSSQVRDEIAGYFSRYKEGEPGKFSKVSGWGSVAEGRDHVVTTHAFFLECRNRVGTTCRI